MAGKGREEQIIMGSSSDADDNGARDLQHLLLMCRRYVTAARADGATIDAVSHHKLLEGFYSCISSADDSTNSSCVLPSCSAGAVQLFRSGGYPKCWCCRRHYLEWLAQFYQILMPDQICKLPGCHRHVCVEGDSILKVRHFCSWQHCQTFYMRPPSSTCTASLHYIKSSIQEQPEPSMHSVLECLKGYVQGRAHIRNFPASIGIDEGFFTKHPWDILNKPGESAPVWLITRCRFKDEKLMKRELITKEGYHWKQQGKSLTCSHTINNDVSRRYLTYTRLRGQHKRQYVEATNDVPGDDRQFYIVEYTLNYPVFKEYCVVKLHKGKLYKSRPLTSDLRPVQTLTNDSGLHEGSPPGGQQHKVSRQRTKQLRLTASSTSETVADVAVALPPMSSDQQQLGAPIQCEFRDDYVADSRLPYDMVAGAQDGNAQASNGDEFDIILTYMNGEVAAARTGELDNDIHELLQVANSFTMDLENFL